MSSSTPTRLTDRKRAAILRAAVSEFRESGFDATSMDRVAAAAGVSKRTVYNHFPSKEALFAQILQELWEASLNGVDGSYQSDQPLRGQLLELILQKLRLLQDPNLMDLARVTIAAAIHSPVRAKDMVSRLGEKEEGLTVWIRAAAADGRLKTDDPLFASMQLQGLVKGFAFWPQVTLGLPHPTDAEQQRIAESAADMFLAHYG